MVRPEATASRVVVEAWRGPRVESQHDVWCAIVPPVVGLPSEVDPADLPAPFMRSAAKPMQLLPVVAAGGAERYGLDAADLAVMAASHSGTDAHANRVAAILGRLGLGPEALRCGVHWPYFLEELPAESAERRRLFGPLHNNCSGNHAALLALAQIAAVDPGRYLDPTTPGQERVHAAIGALAGADPVLAVDDCSAPCYGMPLECMAEAYRFLARPAAVRTLTGARRERLCRVGDLGRVEAALERIAAAMASEPEWVSGTTSGATRLARALPGAIVAKYGAEGVLCVANLEHGMAVALKVADGNSRALMPALLAVAADLGWLGSDTTAALGDLAEPILHGRVGQVVGGLRVRRG